MRAEPHCLQHEQSRGDRVDACDGGCIRIGKHSRKCNRSRHHGHADEPLSPCRCQRSRALPLRDSVRPPGHRRRHLRPRCVSGFRRVGLLHWRRVHVRWRNHRSLIYTLAAQECRFRSEDCKRVSSFCYSAAFAHCLTMKQHCGCFRWIVRPIECDGSTCKLNGRIGSSAMSEAAKPQANRSSPHLQRVLSLGDLFWYGIVAVTPSAPATVFGLADSQSRGHVVLTILAGMVAMVLTAISYGRMASLYPSAGSAYTYVSRGIHPYLGFAAGWAMLLDYIVIPLFCVIYGTLALQRALPWMPFFVGSALFAGGITMLNLHGIRSTARANQVLLAIMFAVLGAFLFCAVRYLWMRQGLAGLFSTAPFYNPATFNVRRIAGATSF